MIIPEKNVGSNSSSSNEDPRLTEMLEETPDREVFVKDNNGRMIGTGILLLEGDTILAPEGFATESGSINFGDLITLSEASGFLAIQNNLKGNRYRLVDHFVPKDAPSSKPGYVQMIEAENEFVSQGVSDTVLNASPLTFQYTTQLFSRVNSLKFKAASNITNFRMKITATGPNVVVKYFPSKSSWIQGIDGVNLVAGDNIIDFKDSPLLFEPGESLSFEIRANNNALLGNSSGFPYMTGMIQRGRFKYLADAQDIPTALSQLSNDTAFATSSSIPTKLSQLTNDQSFVTASQAASNSPVQSVNGQVGNVTLTIPPTQVNSDWNALNGPAQILNKPQSFTPSAHTHPISDIVGLQASLDSKATLEQASSSAPVQSVNGQTGNISLSIPAPQIQSDWNQSNTTALDYIKNKPSIPTVNYPVVSVNGKTGAVALTSTDVGAAPATHIHAIADITGLQTALNNKVGVGAPIAYSVLTGAPTLSTVATSGSYVDLTNKPVIPAAQINSDWSATSGIAQILNKPTTISGFGITDAVTQSSLSSSLGSYATTSALNSGLSTKLNIPTGTILQYIRGDGSLASFPSIPTVPTNLSAFTNDAGYLTGVSSTQIATALGYTPYNGATNPNGYVSQTGARASISITNTGTSGAATYNSTTGVLNIPNYSLSLPNVGTAGSYNGTVVTDVQGRVVSGTNRSITNPTRSLNTAFQLSTSQDALVSYAVDITVASLLIGGTSGRVVLEYANEVGFTTGVTTVTSCGSSTGGVLNITNVNTANLSGVIPAGKYVRLRTMNVTGNPTFTYQSAQETLLG